MYSMHVPEKLIFAFINNLDVISFSILVQRELIILFKLV